MAWREHNVHKAGWLHNAARRTDMTKQERIMHTTRELNSTAHTADVTNCLRLIRAAGRRVGRGGSGSARKWDGATGGNSWSRPNAPGGPCIQSHC
eukprot:6008245-Pyramimonas_sp.AAC.1